MRQAGTVPTHRERLTAPLSWWLAAFAFAATCGWIVLVIGGWTAGVVSTLVVAALAFALVARYGALTLTSDEDGVHAGPAHLSAACVGAAEPLHRVDYRRRLGVDADVRAHLVTRPYLDRGVLVAVDDPQDPTPYWLLSTRDPDALAAAINAHRTTHEGKKTRGEEGR